MNKKILILSFCAFSTFLYPASFFKALQDGDQKTVEQMLHEDKSLAYTSINEDIMPLDMAITSDLEMVKTLVSYGADVNAMASTATRPPLYSAILRYCQHYKKMNNKELQDLLDIIAFLLKSGG